MHIYAFSCINIRAIFRVKRNAGRQDDFYAKYDAFSRLEIGSNILSKLASPYRPLLLAEQCSTVRTAEKFCGQRKSVSNEGWVILSTINTAFQQVFVFLRLKSALPI